MGLDGGPSLIGFNGTVNAQTKNQGLSLPLCSEQIRKALGITRWVARCHLAHDSVKVGPGGWAGSWVPRPPGNGATPP